MKILVLGATGYVGSRLVPSLLEAGHDVVASSSSAPDPERFAWGHEVTWRRCDVTDPDQVADALRDVEAVCYLVHSLDIRSFEDRDRLGAEVVREAVVGSGVRRLVYLSGLVPDVPYHELSRHISSRLEVEEILGEAACSTVALRAGVVIGAGSTSFEVIRQLATLLLVQPVPSWLEQKVQPIAVSDVLRAVGEALDEEHWTELEGAVDIGGPNVLSYSRLLAECSRAAGLLRVRVPTLPVPAPLVSVGTALLCAAPFWTVAALIESLRHDMVCRPGHTWKPRDGAPLLGLREAMERGFGPTGSTPEAPLPSDPDWTRMRAPVLDEIRAPATVRAGASLALKRARAVAGLLTSHLP